MTTITLHRDVQRSRFFHHAAEAMRLVLLGGLAGAPAPQRRVDPARDAAKVRRMANAYLSTDPSFAADLYAAADRHERLAAE